MVETLALLFAMYMIIIIIVWSERQSNYFNRSALNTHKCQFAVCCSIGLCVSVCCNFFGSMLIHVLPSAQY